MKLRDDSGQATVEFAFIALVFIGLVATAISLALLYFQKIAMTDDMRAAARMATVCNSASSNSNYVDPVTDFKNAMQKDGFDTSKISMAAFTCPASGSSFTLTASYPQPVDLFGLSGLQVTTVTLSTTTTGVAE